MEIQQFIFTFKPCTDKESLEKVFEELAQFNPKEVVFCGKKYIYLSDEEKDYLIDNSNNDIKINLTFSKNSKKNKMAEEALKAFFTELYS